MRLLGRRHVPGQRRLELAPTGTFRAVNFEPGSTAEGRTLFLEVTRTELCVAQDLVRLDIECDFLQRGDVGGSSFNPFMNTSACQRSCFLWLCRVSERPLAMRRVRGCLHGRPLVLAESASVAGASLEVL